jgi:hypothetical protein
VAAGFLGLTVLSGPRQDYSAYLEIWRHTMAGLDPWWLEPGRGYRLNAYGPLFAALGPLAWVNPLGPKLVFATVSLGLVGVMGARLDRRGAVALVAYPGLWLHAAWYGHFDPVVAAFCVAAVAGRERGRDAVSGAWLAGGILLKYQPLPLVPFLALGRGRGGWRGGVRMVVACGLTVGVGLGVAAAVWGWSSVVSPLGAAAGRGSMGMSVWRALRGSMDGLAVPVMGAVLAGVWGVCAWRRLPVGAACAAGALVLVNLYPVGFGQYQAIPLGLLAWAWPGERAGWRLRLSAWLYALVVAAYDLADLAAGGFLNDPARWGWVDDGAGLVVASLAGWLVVEWVAAPGWRGLDSGSTPIDRG